MPKEDLECSQKEGFAGEAERGDLNLEEAKVGPTIYPAGEVEGRREQPEQAEELAEGANVWSVG